VGDVIDFIHDECILPESRKPMELHPYQTDLIEQWMDPTTKAHVTMIGAGNAKTTTFGAFLTAHMFLVEEANVPCVATTVGQAVITTWGRVKRFVELNPSLACRAEILEGSGNRSGVYVPGMGGNRCWAIADKPSGLQGLIPSIAALEEMSEADMATFGALMNRMGKRPDSKLIGISTPSFMPDNALLNVQRSIESGEALPGVVMTEHKSLQKDHRDEAGWVDANPALAAGILDIGAIRTDLAILPEQQFRAYRLCQTPVGSQSCWLNAVDDDGDELGDAYDVWKRGESAYTFVENQPTWVGVDVAKSRDHAAVVWGQFRDDGRLHAKAKVWTPTKTADIDLEEIADHLRMLCGKYSVKQISYDPSYFYNAPMLERDGLPMVATPPTDTRMAPLCGHAYQAIRRTRITHDGDDQLTRHVLAGKRRYCSHGFTIEKIQYANKCDAAIALVLMHGAATGVDLSPDYSDPRAWKVH
jgi:phage terminase large subunit-like protein